MSQLIVSEYVTTDGVMEAPDRWSVDFWSDESATYKRDELFAAGALLLGRVTYEGFAAAWPSATDEDGFADRMNSIPKFVVSTTLTDPEWTNTTVIRENVVDEITRLKEQVRGDILVFGSADLVATLREHDLVDEYRLMVYPVVNGSGKRLFGDSEESLRLDLTDSRTFSTGVVVNAYRPSTHDTEQLTG